MRIVDIRPGMRASRRHVVRREDIVAFAAVSGDDNPVHVDERYAAGTRFKGCIAHGILTASFISAVLGTELPGEGAVYLEQTLRFKSPVRPGDEVLAEVVVENVARDSRQVTLATQCRVGDRVVLEGTARLLAPA
jgi:3-hydroxybutyryl-CoA dehydratase